jgi:60 kDa SS-A/Ro ribonucleoprotein
LPLGAEDPMNYNFFTRKQTPQNQPIPGRETEMIQGRSGGWMFDAGIWQMVRRCLLIGTAQGTYYADKRELTDDFVQTIKEAVAEDPHRLAEEIVYASEGRAINNSAPILAFAFYGRKTRSQKSFFRNFSSSSAYWQSFLRMVELYQVFARFWESHSGSW